MTSTKAGWNKVVRQRNTWILLGPIVDLREVRYSRKDDLIIDEGPMVPLPAWYLQLYSRHVRNWTTIW